mmetsp:Transcript_21175/g.55273  ORF Transcript_21175/g.55273 Transcript_21175/m.55273 type:complete len:210 (+) Transcript_21175:777-1406(+)
MATLGILAIEPDLKLADACSGLTTVWLLPCLGVWISTDAEPSAPAPPTSASTAPPLGAKPGKVSLVRRSTCPTAAPNDLMPVETPSKTAVLLRLSFDSDPSSHPASSAGSSSRRPLFVAAALACFAEPRAPSSDSLSSSPRERLEPAKSSPSRRSHHTVAPRNTMMKAIRRPAEIPTALVTGPLTPTACCLTSPFAWLARAAIGAGAAG